MNMSHVWIAARWSGFYDELFTYLAAAGLGVFNRGEGVVCGPRSELRLGLGRNKDPSGARREGAEAIADALNKSGTKLMLFETSL